MIVRLILLRKRKRVWTAQVRENEATLGRAVGCTVRIPSSQVSRLHCRLRIEDGIVTVEDLESVNGTFINGKRVREAEIVHPGDRLSVGPATFLVEYELSSATLEPLEGDEDHGVRETESDLHLLELVDPEAEPESHVVTDDKLEVVEPPEDDVEIVEEPAPKPKKKKSQPPMEQPLEVIEDTDVETVPLAEQEEIQLGDSSNLRDFLIELDNTEDPSSE
jgi:pSer/pThr/pTyr-binding forkhead associated (FHA) protein